MQQCLNWYVSCAIGVKKAAQTTKVWYKGQPDIRVHFQKSHCVPYIRLLLYFITCFMLVLYHLELPLIQDDWYSNELKPFRFTGQNQQQHRYMTDMRTRLRLTDQWLTNPVTDWVSSKYVQAQTTTILIIIIIIIIMARHEPYFLPHPIQSMTTVHTFYAKGTVLATCVTILSFCSIKYPPFFHCSARPCTKSFRQSAVS